MRIIVRAGLASAVACLAFSGIAGASAASAATSTAKTASPPDFVAGAFQKVSSDGTSADVTVAAPKLATSDLATGALIAVASANGQQQVLAGWMVSRYEFGDSHTHFFVSKTVNGNNTVLTEVGSGGFKQLGACRPGELLTPGTDQKISVRHLDGGWQVGLGHQVCGEFPDSLWHNQFTSAAESVWSGFVTTNASKPCSQMGNGKFASNPAAAEFSDIRLLIGAKGTQRVPELTGSSPTPKFYSRRRVSNDAVRFGGAGACVS